MPTYEYRCRECDTVFELERPMRESSAAATCPDGHRDAVRVLSVFAAVTSSPAGSASSALSPAGSRFADAPGTAGSRFGDAPGTAGACGAACACHPH